MTTESGSNAKKAKPLKGLALMHTQIHSHTLMQHSHPLLTGKKERGKNRINPTPITERSSTQESGEKKTRRISLTSSQTNILLYALLCALCIVCPCFFSPFAIRSSFIADLDLFIEATHSHSHSQSFLIIIMSSVSLSIMYQHSRTHSPHCFCSLTDQSTDLSFSYVHVCSICWRNSSKWFSCRMRFYRIHQCLLPARLACQRIIALNAFYQWKHCVRTKPTWLKIQYQRFDKLFFGLFHQHHKTNISGFLEKIPQWNVFWNHTICVWHCSRCLISSNTSNRYITNVYTRIEWMDCFQSQWILFVCFHSLHFYSPLN